MANPARAVVTLSALALSALAVAQGTSDHHSAPPSSYAPRPHGGGHQYGAPIDPPLVGHAKPSSRHNAKKQAGGLAKPAPHASRDSHTKQKVQRPPPDRVPAAPAQSN
jgi:hypothetical protein